MPDQASVSEPPAPLTRNVFVDTSIFINKRFNFEGSELAALKRLVANDQIYLFTTPITLKELQANLNELADKAFLKVNKLQKDLEVGILRCLDGDEFSKLFNPLPDNLKDQLQAKLASYIEDCRFETLPAYDVNLEKVFDAYFSTLPPFGSGDKKSEFPDAVVIYSLLSWCNKNNEKIYVVSSDKDFSRACEGQACLHHIQSLAEVINLINLEDYEITLESNKQEILDAVLEFIPTEFCNLGFVCEDNYDAEAYCLRVLKVSPENEIYVLNKEDDLITVEVVVKVDFEVEITSPVYRRDSEDRVNIHIDDDSNTMEREAEVTVSLKVALYEDAANRRIAIEVDTLQITEPENVSVYLYDPWDYM